MTTSLSRDSAVDRLPSSTPQPPAPPSSTPQPSRLDVIGDGALAARTIGTMWRIRLFEEAVDELFARGLMHGTMHLSIGQEASATGVCLALQPGDLITSTHRGHGHCIAKGADLTRMMAELLAKETGYCRGRGGSMHIADFATGNLGANGIVGGGIPIAVGAALAQQMRGTPNVVVSFFGDGATNEGAFHEALNLAAVWQLPVVFVCENNKYGMSMSVERSTHVARLSDRATAYGMPGVTADGNDLLAAYTAAAVAVDRARDGGGPSLLELETYRWKGHSKSDKNLYRTRDEIEDWRSRDPIVRYRDALLEHDTMTEAELESAREAAREDVRRAVVEASGAAPARADDLLDGVFRKEPLMTVTEQDLVQPDSDRTGTAVSTVPGRQATYAEQVRAALTEAMRADDRVLLFGEDVGLYGGAFGVSAGMLEEFGADRVRDTPISELGIVGAAVGLALCGMRPIVEIQFSDFTAQAMDQIVNQAAKIHFMLGGAANVPMVLRAPGGSGTGAAAQHSQSLEAWFAHVPGLKVVMPSSAADVGGLLLSAIEDPDPVIFLEHKLLYKIAGPVPDVLTPIPLGKSFVARTGTDITVVATGIMVSRALEAAESLAAEGISVEVIDPRTVSPLDDRPILDSVRTTGRVVLVQEAPRDLGFMAEVATRIAETETLYYLNAPIVRLAGLNAPIPYAPELEKASVPQVADIIAACHGLAKGA